MVETDLPSHVELAKSPDFMVPPGVAEYILNKVSPEGEAIPESRLSPHFPSDWFLGILYFAISWVLENNLNIDKKTKEWFSFLKQTITDGLSVEAYTQPSANVRLRDIFQVQAKRGKSTNKTHNFPLSNFYIIFGKQPILRQPTYIPGKNAQRIILYFCLVAPHNKLILTGLRAVPFVYSRDSNNARSNATSGTWHISLVHYCIPMESQPPYNNRGLRGYILRLLEQNRLLFTNFSHNNNSVSRNPRAENPRRSTPASRIKQAVQTSIPPPPNLFPRLLGPDISPTQYHINVPLPRQPSQSRGFYEELLQTFQDIIKHFTNHTSARHIFLGNNQHTIPVT